jgi:predicted amidophosphoribosyltransferase
MSINPIKLSGIWNDGYALDYHVLSSTYTGEDVFGHPQYETIRTPIGKALYQFKYRNNYNAIKDIMELTKPFLDQWDALHNIDVILPVPPSKKTRLYQPVFEITRAIAEYVKIPFTDDVLIKITDEQSKNKSGDEKQQIENTIIVQKPAKRECNILLVDDLFQSGATISECVRVLKQDNNIKDIYVLAITKTRGEDS